MAEIIGWIGTALVIVAYYPQIQHLFVEKCAWGISVATWVIWLVSSVLLLTYAWMQRDVLFILVQITNILAIATTIVLVRRSNRICPTHAAAAAKRAPASQQPEMPVSLRRGTPTAVIRDPIQSAAAGPKP